jgi:hypothetical protein
MDSKLAQFAIGELGLKLDELEEQIKAMSMFTPPAKNKKEKEVKEKKPKAAKTTKAKKTEPEGPKKPRNITEKGYFAKAKMLYYHEMKNSAEVKALFPNKIMWTEVKKHTDNMFSELPEDFQSIYVNQAKDIKLDDAVDDIDDLVKALH